MYPYRIKPAPLHRLVGLSVHAWMFLMLAVGGFAQEKPNDSHRENFIPVIFDTDIDTDCDDVGAVACLHAMADAGEIRILATTVSSNFAYSAPCLDGLNRYYGRGELPLGVPRRPGASVNRGSRYARQIAERFPGRFTSNDEAPSAVSVLRRVLAEAENHSVRMVTVGYLTNVADLLRSAPDDISPLNGSELAIQKVSHLVVMGGRYPEHLDPGKFGNFKPDPESAVYVSENWPGTIYFSGLGENVGTGRNRSLLPQDHPLRVAYDLYLGDQPTRPSWDQTALLFAVRPAADYWKVRTDGGNQIYPDGTNRWVDEDPGDHRLVEFNARQRPIVEAEIEQLMTRHTAPAANTRADGLSFGNLAAAFGIVDQAVSDGELPGAAVLVMQHGQLVASRGYGICDMESGRPFRDDTICWIASLTKPITVAAAMTLVDDGKLELDTKVEDYLPAFANLQTHEGHHGSVTVRQLMSHASGIDSKVPSRPRFFFTQAWFDRELAEVTDQIAKSTLQFQPGKKVQYSNAAPYVTGRIIEIQSGKSFGRYVHDQVLTPLGMVDTGFSIPDDKLDRAAVVYRREDDDVVTYCRYNPDWKIRMTMPDGGLFSTPRDIAIFANEFLDGKHRLLSAESRQAMQSEQSHGYGLGWILDADNQFSHWGSSGTLVWADRSTGVVGLFFAQIQDHNRVSAIQRRFRSAVNAAFEAP